MLTLLCGIVAFGLFFGCLSVRMWVKKEATFRGTCASQNPLLRKEGGRCGYCGKPVPEEDEQPCTSSSMPRL